MKPGRTSTMAAAVVLVLGALIGITGASTASAAAWSHLCVERSGESICANSNGSGQPIQMLDIVTTNPHTTNWLYPASDGVSGVISQANVNLCMQVDAADNWIVRGAACVGDTAEEWTNHYVVDNGVGRTEFRSVWADDNYGGAWCLAWVDSVYASQAYVQSCDGSDANTVEWGQS